MSEVSTIVTNAVESNCPIESIGACCVGVENNFLEKRDSVLDDMRHERAPNASSPGMSCHVDPPQTPSGGRLAVQTANSKQATSFVIAEESFPKAVKPICSRCPIVVQSPQEPESFGFTLQKESFKFLPGQYINSNDIFAKSEH